MPTYLHQAAYTAESWAAQVKNPEDRLKTGTRPAIEAVGGKLIAGGFMFGEHNVVAIFEAPDDVSAAAFAATVNAGGALRSESTQRLLSGDEWVNALKKASEVGGRYSPPLPEEVGEAVLGPHFD